MLPYSSKTGYHLAIKYGVSSCQDFGLVCKFWFHFLRLVVVAMAQVIQFCKVILCCISPFPLVCWCLKANSYILYCSHAVLKANLHIPCRSPTATLPLPCHSPAISFQQFFLLNCYHNVCAVNYTSTHVLAPK
jgi:hypothetical protein